MRDCGSTGELLPVAGGDLVQAVMGAPAAQRHSELGFLDGELREHEARLVPRWILAVGKESQRIKPVSASQGCNTGSNPVGSANKISKLWMITGPSNRSALSPSLTLRPWPLHPSCCGCRGWKFLRGCRGGSGRGARQLLRRNGFGGGAQSWAVAPELQAVMVRAGRKSSAPIFFFQAANDYDLSSSNTLADAMKDACKTHELNWHGMSLMALLEDHGRVAAGYAVGDQRTEVLLLCALVQERIAHERDERLEFSSFKRDRRLEERVEAGEHRFDRPQSVPKVLVYARLFRIVAARRTEHIQMVADRIL